MTESNGREVTLARSVIVTRETFAHLGEGFNLLDFAGLEFDGLVLQHFDEVLFFVEGVC